MSAAETTLEEPPPETLRTARHSRQVVARWSMPAFLALLVLGFSLARPSTFATAENFKAIVAQQSVPAILALAAVAPLLAGEFDISIGGTLTFSAVLSAWGFGHGWPLTVVVVAALAAGLVVAAINTLLVVVLEINSFIATLAVTTVLAGLVQWLTNGTDLFAGIPSTFTKPVQGRAVGVPLVCFYTLLAAIVLWYAIEQTPFGRRLKATGRGREAARLIGVRTGRHVAGALFIAGLIAALAGVLEAARTGSAGPSAGAGYLLPAYAAAFLGATTIRRDFNVWGTIVGVLVLSVGISGLTLLGAPTWVPDVFNGIALIVALAIGQIAHRRNLANR